MFGAKSGRNPDRSQARRIEPDAAGDKRRDRGGPEMISYGVLTIYAALAVWAGLFDFDKENTMIIQILSDDRVFQGTPLQIVEAMHYRG